MLSADLNRADGRPLLLTRCSLIECGPLFMTFQTADGVQDAARELQAPLHLVVADRGDLQALGSAAEETRERAGTDRASPLAPRLIRIVPLSGPERCRP